ncbi:hypothetical protein EDB87DRAFT_1676114 [Lactarius vividus]|nr:hypothetical protein EDB87DRAFT_1676114 [Lactarius vividus]
MWPIPSPVVAPPRAPFLKQVNDIPLTRDFLKFVLNDFSERLYHSFRRQVRLVVHGGAVMSTQDVDYIHRAFAAEYRALGYPDCRGPTAAKFHLGADWINDHADVALPYGSRNSVPQTIFNERGLALVAVPWPWAIALKLVRYAKKDPVDCAAVLRLGFAQRGIRWTLAGLEQWIMERCWPMGYSGYQPPQRAQLRQRIQDALTRAFPEGTPSSSSSSSSSSHRPPLRMTSETSLYFSH